MTNGVFRIEYPTGYMELNVREFFANANKKRMTKVLKLAKQYCSDLRRDELINALRSEVDRLNEVVETLESLRQSEQYCLQAFFPQARIEPSGYEKALRRQREKLTESVALIRDERWDG
jgi:hypothetical protein